MTTGNRVVLYGRVSSLLSESRGRPAAGTEARSVDDQLAELRRWADREGMHVVAELRDDGISASRYAHGKVRPDWQRVMELISSGQVDLLAVWAIARATRDRAVWSALIAACIENNVHLVVDGRIHDPADPDDGFMLDLRAALAFHGSARISKDAKRSVESRAAKGKPHGRLLDGYMIEYDPATGKPLCRVLDPERAPIIREIAERLLAGESAYAIAADLNTRGITTRTGKAWRGGNIVKRMQSPTLAGRRVHHGRVLDDVTTDWPPILTVEEHHRLLALFGDLSRKSNREGNHVRHLGTGIYLCGVCGTAVRMISGYRPNGTRRVRYGCPAKHCVMRSAEHVDAMVEERIIRRLRSPDVLAELRNEETAEAVQTAAAEVAELRAELVQAREMHRRRKLSLESLAHMESWMLPAIAEAEHRARPAWMPEAVADIAGPEAAERWAQLEMSVKRAVVKALVTVEIMPTGPTNNRVPFNTSAILVTPRSRNLIIGEQP